MKPIVIAIDGPSGAGKGTVSRTVSHVLGFRHVDTGAMYRAVGWKALHDVTHAIRTPEMDKTAASVARLPKVRAVLVARQRALGEQGGVVMEGRDIGTVVFPNAQLKIYLDASTEERARRRANDAAHTGGQVGQAAVAEAIQARDQSDKTRAASPLTLARDAVLIDTTDMPIDEVVQRVLDLARERSA